MMEFLNTQFDASFFCEETRNGFFISNKQKRIWAVEIDLLNKLLDVCKRHDILIFVTGGTLLGAIRHKGFIPWDDDIDIHITRENYLKLLSVSDEFQYPYFLQTARSDKRFYIEYARLRNSETTGIITGMDDPSYNCGIYIDLSVYDACPEDNRVLQKQLKKCIWTKRLCRLYYDDLKSKYGLNKLVSCIIKNTVFKIFSYEYFIKKNEKALRKYEGRTPYVSALFVDEIKKVQKLRCRLNDLNEQIYVQFENIQVPIWKNYEEYLIAMYGDYMEFPPVEDRGKWHEGVILFNPDESYTEYFKHR